MHDLIATKLSAIANRGSAHDFWDLHTMLSLGGISVQDALDLFQRKFASLDIGHVIRALCCFDDANAAPLPRGLEAKQWRAICSELSGWARKL